MFDPSQRAVIVPNATAKSKVVATFPTQAIPVLTAAEAHYPAQNNSLSNTDLRGLGAQDRFCLAAIRGAKHGDPRRFRHVLLE